MTRFTTALGLAAFFAACGASSSNGTTAGTTTGTTGSTTGSTTAGGTGAPTIVVPATFDTAAWRRATFSVPVTVTLGDSASVTVIGKIADATVCTTTAAPYDCTVDTSGLPQANTLTLTVSGTSGENTATTNFKVDNVAPITTLVVGPDEVPVLFPGIEITINSSGDVSSTASDEGSGLATFEVLAKREQDTDFLPVVTLPNAAEPTLPSNASFTVTGNDLALIPEGVYSLKLRVTDFAGNTGESAVVTGVLDNAAPTVSAISLLYPSPALGTPPAVKASVTISATMTDPGQGIAAFTINDVTDPGSPSTLCTLVFQPDNEPTGDCNCTFPVIDDANSPRSLTASCQLDTTSADEGVHALAFIATERELGEADIATAQNPLFEVNIDRTAPSGLALELLTGPYLPGAQVPLHPMFAFTSSAERIHWGALSMYTVPGGATCTGGMQTSIDPSDYERAEFTSGSGASLRYGLWASVKRRLHPGDEICFAVIEANDDAGNPIDVGSTMPFDLSRNDDTRQRDWLVTIVPPEPLNAQTASNSPRARNAFGVIAPSAFGFPAGTLINVTVADGGALDSGSSADCTLTGMRTGRRFDFSCAMFENVNERGVSIDTQAEGLAPDVYLVEGRLNASTSRASFRLTLSVESPNWPTSVATVLSLPTTSYTATSNIVLRVAGLLSATSITNLQLDGGTAFDLAYESSSAALILTPHAPLVIGSHTLTTTGVTDLSGHPVDHDALTFDVVTQAHPATTTVSTAATTWTNASITLPFTAPIALADIEQHVHAFIDLHDSSDRIPLFGLQFPRLADRGPRPASTRFLQVSAPANEVYTHYYNVAVAGPVFADALVLELNGLKDVDGAALPPQSVSVSVLQDGQGDYANTVPMVNQLEVSATTLSFNLVTGGNVGTLLSLDLGVSDGCHNGVDVSEVNDLLSIYVSIDGGATSVTEISDDTLSPSLGSPDICEKTYHFDFGGKVANTQLGSEGQTNGLPTYTAERALLDGLSPGLHTVTVRVGDSINATPGDGHDVSVTRRFIVGNGVPSLTYVGLPTLTGLPETATFEGELVASAADAFLIGGVAEPVSSLSMGQAPFPIEFLPGNSPSLVGQTPGDLGFSTLSRFAIPFSLLLIDDFSVDPSRVLGNVTSTGNVIVHGAYSDSNVIYAADFSDVTGVRARADDPLLHLNDSTFSLVDLALVDDGIVGPSFSLACPALGRGCLDTHNGWAQSDFNGTLEFTNFTMQAWVRSVDDSVDINDHQVVLSGSDASDQATFELGVVSNFDDAGTDIVYAVYQNGSSAVFASIQGTHFVSGTEPHHIAFTAATNVFFIDGVSYALQDPVAVVPSTVGATTKVYIGRGATPPSTGVEHQPLRGIVDDVKLSNEAPSSTTLYYCQRVNAVSTPGICL